MEDRFGHGDHLEEMPEGCAIKGQKFNIFQQNINWLIMVLVI